MSVANNVQPAEKLLEVYIAEIADMGISSAELQQFRQGARTAIEEFSNNSPPSSKNSSVMLSAADFGTERALEDMLKDDYSDLVETAADSEFPRMVAELYEYSTELEEFGTDDPIAWETPFAGFAMQLWRNSGITVVYVRQGLLSTLLCIHLPDKLTEAIRAIYRKTKLHRVQHPHLHSGTVLLSEVENLAKALKNAVLESMLSKPAACQPCLDTQNVRLAQRCEVIGCSYAFQHPNKLTCALQRRAHMTEWHEEGEMHSEANTPLSHVVTDAGVLVLPIRASPRTLSHRRPATRVVTDTTFPYKLPLHCVFAGGAIDSPHNVVRSPR
ncbi:hypothetical protein CKM354_000122900 [Cercospora kikuchii]|nr:uncharacterized protein CKM354_000122900 [Cercospora kikuchii]GIZ37795.1 hypothetical protein CKM354_000122900 [Cercospora kikuchii]